MNAEELSRQLQLLKLDLKDRSKETLVGSERLVKEFANLSLPIETEILDVGPGTGFMSACLQTGGFTSIDALEDDLPTLRNLQALRLYRNYICREAAGLNATGLREESYDAIMNVESTAACANPAFINEMLRVLKPGGHLLLAINSSAVEGSSDIGLFDLNIQSLQKEGKFELMKREKILDAGACSTGFFYLFRRLAGHQPEYLDKPVSRNLEDSVTKILVDTSDAENRIKFYDSWSSNYDEDLVVIGNYTGHIKCVEAFLKLRLDHSVQILDVAAGTGLLGAEVLKHGFEFIDALDSSIGMLNQAKKQDIYKNYIHATVDKIGSIPVNNDTYDVILMANGLAPGQIYPSSLPELLRVLRPGGYLLWTMKEGFQKSSQQFAMLDSFIENLVRQDAASLVVGPVVFQRYLLNNSGRFYMLRKPNISHWATGSPKGSPKVTRKH